MFAVVANDGKAFYTGRAGDGWLGDKAEAFTYSREGAERKAAMFNENSRLHGYTFKVEQI